MKKRRLTRKLTLFEWFVLIPWTPVVGLALFWVLPWVWALFTYVAASVTAGWLAWKSWQAMRIPIASGREAMIGATAEALSEIQRDGQIRFRGEIWRAQAAAGQKILPGERVQIVSVEGLQVTVSKVSSIESSSI